MFGKSKQTAPVVETAFGWTEQRLDRLEKTLSGNRPSFVVPLVGFAQTYGRNVMDPHNPFSQNELFGSVETLGAVAEGRIDIEPIGTVGHVSFEGRGTGELEYRPRVVFHLAVLDGEQEARMQQQLHAAFAAKIIPSVLLFLEPVDNAAERIRELREEGGCDPMPLRSFRLILEFGRVE